MLIIDFENWAWYRPGDGKMLPEDIDPNLCTHVMYSFATLDPNTLLLKIHDTWADIDNSKSLKLLFDRKKLYTTFRLSKIGYRPHLIQFLVFRVF